VSDYRRNYVPGGTYFFTVVTYDRRRILTGETSRACLRRAILAERIKRPFQIIAFVLLPDHLHTVWTLPRGDAEFSLRWRKIKENYTRLLLKAEVPAGPRPIARPRRREQDVWQRRFWEHTCRGEDDLKRCVDYVHWNPVKHRLVRRAGDYPWSSFHRFVREGEYGPDWGVEAPCSSMIGVEWD